MTDLEQWLTTLGLAQYSRHFAENDIDFEVLRELSDADLEKLGISLGHRRKLLRALETRRSDEAVPVPAHASGSVPPLDSVGAQRRQITVLFCDLIGSTELAHALDPEDVDALVRRYQDACSGTVARFDGYVAKFMGDGILAYFGYPQASEHAAEQAVRSAGAIVSAVSKVARPDGKPLEVRIGIATGIVVIGDVLGSGSARERQIAGDTPNLAARLQALAGPNEVLVSPRTHQLLGGSFEYESLGDHLFKGFSEPIQVWRVAREATFETRFAAIRATNRGEFVGRSEELALLLDSWHRAVQGNGHAIHISGEAGMGKSRLAITLSEEIGDRSHSCLIFQCSPYHTNSALYPVIRYLERAARFASTDCEELQLTKLEAMLDELEGGSSPASKSLMADLLSLPNDRHPPLDMSPPQRKTATLSVLADLFTLSAARKPVLILLEDAHWIDPTTTELWMRLIDQLATSRVLLVVTSRPDVLPTWKARENVSLLDLARLSIPQATRLAASVASPRVLEASLLDDIVAKSDGIPLYVEELTKTMLEFSPADRPVVPATLHDSLTGRLDRLGAAKDVAQVAAVIGPQFSTDLLAKVVSCSPADLSTALRRLVEAGLAYRSSSSADTTYNFTHALVRDVAYENLLRARRVELHEKIGRTIVDQFPSLTESEPELLAHHFHCAHLFELALKYLERAGDRAVERSSFLEAIAHFNSGLNEVYQLKDLQQRERSELKLLLKLGPTQAAVKRNHDKDVADTYERALTLAVTLGDQDGLFKATWGRWFNGVQGRRLDVARDQANALISLARSSGNEDYLLEGFHCLWSTALFCGDVSTAFEIAREGVARYDRDRHRWMGRVFGGHDPGVCAYVVRSISLSQRGQYGEAKRSFAHGIALGESLKHPNSHAHALINALVAAQIGGDYGTVDIYGQQLIAIADKYNLPPPRAHALFLSACGRAFTTDLDGGMEVMEAEFPRASAIGPFFRYYAALLAEGREKSGRFQDALTLLRAMIETVVEPCVGFYISELYRLQGLCLLGSGDGTNVDEAMQSLRTAIDTAQKQTATMLELRATLSFARAELTFGGNGGGATQLRALCTSLSSQLDSAQLKEATEFLSTL